MGHASFARSRIRTAPSNVDDTIAPYCPDFKAVVVVVAVLEVMVETGGSYKSK